MSCIELRWRRSLGLELIGHFRGSTRLACWISATALGNYQRIAKAKQATTTADAEAARPVIAERAHLSLRGTGDHLNRRGLTTAGGKPWHAMQVRRRARQRLGL